MDNFITKNYYMVLLIKLLHVHNGFTNQLSNLIKQFG